MMKQEGPPEGGAREKTEEGAAGKAAAKIVREWLRDVGFQEDPVGENSERIKIIGPGYEGDCTAPYVDVRIYVPQIDIDLELDETREEGAL